jgi:light-regulated signal transduction histidine kinase (bacteriophytochrome)
MSDKQINIDAKTYQALTRELETLRSRVQELEREQNLNLLAKSQDNALFTVVNKIRECLDLETIFQTATREVRHLLRVDRVCIYRFDRAYADLRTGTGGAKAATTNRNRKP